MTIVAIHKNENGSHANQTTSVNIEIKEGWALVPNDLPVVNFPFGDLETDIIDGVVTVTKWTPLPIPEPQPLEPTLEERVQANSDAIDDILVSMLEV